MITGRIKRKRGLQDINCTMFRYCSLSLFLLSIVTFTFCSPVADSLKQDFQNVYRDDVMLGIIQSWLPKLVDEDDFRLIQNYWGRVDRDSMGEWFKQKHLVDQDNPMFHYLWLRTLNDSNDCLDGAEAIINAHPDYYWAYRMLASEFSKILSISTSCFGGSYARERLDAKESIYIELLLQGERIFGPDPHIHSALGDYYEYHGEWGLLESIAVKLAQCSEQPIINKGFIYRICSSLETAEPAKRVLPLYVATKIKLQKAAPQDSLKIYNAGMMRAFYQAGDWNALDSLLVSDPNLLKDREYPYVVLPMLLNLGRVTEAVELAREFVLKGHSFDNMIDHSKLDWDEHDPLWEEFVDRIPEYEEQVRIKEQEQFEQNRLGKELPNLEIRDESGNLIHLNDWLGKDLTICFWNSWDEGTFQVFRWQAEDPEPENIIYVNGYDSNPGRAKAILQVQVPGAVYYSIDDASLQRLGVGMLPSVIVIGPKGKLDYLDDEYGIFQGMINYPSD